MNERHEQILGEVVRIYLDTGKPVGSCTISRQGRIDLKPASIRSVMSELEKQGLLFSPHTSAGRVPTDAGLRYFVDSLMVMDKDMQQSLERLVSLHLKDVEEKRTLLRRATDELASLTHFAGMVWVREPGFYRIHRLELVPVSSERILAVIVTDSGDVRNCLLRRPPLLAGNDLHRLSMRLNDMLQDCSLEEARLRLRREMKLDRMHIHRLLADLKRWADAPMEEQEDIIVSGQRQLLNMPEFGVIDTVRSLMATFEEKGQLLRLVEQVEREEYGVRVFIGSEHALVDMEQVSVVLARYEGPLNTVGTLGVIGPKRMHYDRVLPIVDYTARRVSWMLGGMH